MKITKRQLRQIIREERARLAEQADPHTMGRAAAGGASPADQGIAAARAEAQARKAQGFHGGDFGIHDATYLFDFLSDEVESYLAAAGEATLSGADLRQMRSALTAAADRIEAEFGE
jgi:hypothetical protein